MVNYQIRKKNKPHIRVIAREKLLVLRNAKFRQMVKWHPCFGNFNMATIILGTYQGWIHGKSRSITLFTMILYSSENSIHDILRLFAIRCVVTVMLWSILHLSCISEPVMRLDYQMLLKSPSPNLIGCIHPWNLPCLNFSFAISIMHSVSRHIPWGN